MRLSPDRDVLLFFEDVDRDTFVRNDRRLRRLLRKASYLVRKGRQRVSGFEVAFLLLKKALERIGRRVHVNDRRLARANPDFPIGIAGYPHILRDWPLPNPAVLGPGLVDHPRLAPELMKDPRFKLYIVTCAWYEAMFEPFYGKARLARWYAGIDLAEWPDLGGQGKNLDVLIYDKIHWRRDELTPTLLVPVQQALAARGLRCEVLRYGHYQHEQYRALLSRARAMIWLSEHETQGLAYQEAMASGVPVLAWDAGIWVDPQARSRDPLPVPATSVPYFSPECGERFRDAEEFRTLLLRFWEALPRYTPRAYVERELSLEGSAQLYLSHLRSAAL